MALKPQEWKILTILAGGEMKNIPILKSLCQLPYKRKFQVFKYMISHGITGKSLQEFAEQNLFLPWRMYAAIVHRIDGHMKTPMNVRKEMN